MLDEVSKIGNASFILNGDGSLLNKTINADFQLVEDFFQNDISQVQLGDQDDVVENKNEGTVLTSNKDVVFTDTVYIYLARFRKGQCDWEPVIFYDIFNGDNPITLDEWEILYANDNYVVYRIYSKEMPETLPYGGEVPPNSDASFIRYEKYINYFSRTDCEFKYNTTTHKIEYVEEPGNDEWVVSKAGRNPGEEDLDPPSDGGNESMDFSSSSSSDGVFEACEMTYTKSTPVGCDSNPPSLLDADLSGCDCLNSEDLDFINSSSSFSSEFSNSSSFSSISSDSSSVQITGEVDQKIPYDGAEEGRRRSFQDVDLMYLRIDGAPFTGFAYNLGLIADPPETIWAIYNNGQVDEIKLSGEYEGRTLYFYQNPDVEEFGYYFAFNNTNSRWERPSKENFETKPESQWSSVFYFDSLDVYTPLTDGWVASDGNGNATLETSDSAPPPESESSSESLENSSSSSPQKSSSSSSSSFSSASSSSSSSSRLESFESDIVKSWSTDIFDERTKSEGSITLILYNNGIYSLNADLIVDGKEVKIRNGYLNNIYSENIQASGNYTKGVGSLSLGTVYVDGVNDINSNYDCYISYENMYKASNNSMKKISEIIFDYEREEMVQDEYSPFIDLYLHDPVLGGDPCAAVGSFRLENVNAGEWYYKSNDKQEVRLSMAQSGRWTLYRKYIIDNGIFAEFTANIDSLHVVNSLLDNAPSFSCIGIINKSNLFTAENGCNGDLLVAFVSSEDEDLNSLTTYEDSLNLTLGIDESNYFNNTDFELYRIFNRNNFALWLSYIEVGNGLSEYAIVMTYEGLNWRMCVGNTDSLVYMTHEFASINNNVNQFDTVMRYIPSYNVRIDRFWSLKNVDFVISG